MYGYGSDAVSDGVAVVGAVDVVGAVVVAVVAAVFVVVDDKIFAKPKGWYFLVDISPCDLVGVVLKESVSSQVLVNS